MIESQVLLGELCDVVAGGTPPRSHPEMFSGTVPWVKIGDMLNDPIVKTEEMLSDKGLAACRAKVLPIDTIVMSIFATVGRTSVLGIPAATNQAIVGLQVRDTTRLCPRYLRRYLDYAAPRLKARSRGVAQTNINTTILKSLPVLLPFEDDQKKSFQEQRRIAEILDTADSARRTQAGIRYELERLPQSLFDETFERWLGLPVSEMPELGNAPLAEIVSGVTKGRKFKNQTTVVVPYIRVANVQDGYLDLDEIKDIEALPSDVDTYRLQHGDVLMTEGGDFDKLGRGAMWEADVPDCIHQNHVFRVRCDREIILPEYFACYIRTGLAKAYFLKCAKKTSNLASINKTQLKALPVPVPPIDLQKRFASQLHAIKQLSKKQEEATSEAEDLFQSLLQRAFAGEL